MYILSKEKLKFCALLKMLQKYTLRNDRNNTNLYGENHNLQNWFLFYDY